MSTASSDHTGI